MAQQIGGAQFTGKEGAKVSTTGGVVRRLRIPKNGKSIGQVRARSILATLSTRFRDMPVAEQASWKQAALNYSRTNRAGISRTLTGLQLYVQTNGLAFALKEQIGENEEDKELLVPPVPQFVSGIALLTSGAALEITVNGDLLANERLVIYATRPQSSGTNRATSGKLIAMLKPTDITENAGPPITFTADVLAAYSAKFGAPPVGTRIFLEAYTIVIGEMIKRPAGSAIAVIV